jgi:hypothetical protein
LTKIQQYEELESKRQELKAKLMCLTNEDEIKECNNELVKTTLNQGYILVDLKRKK